MAIQLQLPEGYREDTYFREVLATLRDYGFYGVELNILHPERIVPADLGDFLYQYDLKMTMVATGAAAKERRLSLSSTDEEVRSRSARECRDFIELAGLFRAGVIVGYLKGGPGEDLQGASRSLEESLRGIVPLALERRVPILIEATNRYESSLANTLDGAYALTSPFDEASLVQILPDTFHMNIEEKDICASLEKHKAHYSNIHLSDNNRCFPGYGAIQFADLFAFLRSLDYAGTITIEGNIKEDLVSDIHATMRYLQPKLRAASKRPGARQSGRISHS